MILEIKNLKKHFGGVKAVDGISFNIEKGKITAIIGPNGSGKTTAFNLISGVIKPGEGQIIFNNHDMQGHSIEEVSRHGISRMFQKSRLFNNLTVEENLDIAIDDDDVQFWKNFFGIHKINDKQKAKINELLQKVNMQEHLKRFCRELSFGQKRLIEIVRTIINPHEMLMLDEPVAGVNPRLRKTIAELLLEQKAEGDTILLIEHDMEFTLGISDYVIVFDEGKIIAQGTPKQIRKNKKVLEAYLGE